MIPVSSRGVAGLVEEGMKRCIEQRVQPSAVGILPTAWYCLIHNNTMIDQTAFDLKEFMVDQTTDLLYFINTDDCETLCVPDVKYANGGSIRYHVFLEMHDSLFYGHRGVQATYAQLRQKYYWPKLHKEVHKYIGSCIECQYNKIDRQKPKGLMHPVQVPTLPAQAYNMDFMTDLPKALYKGQTYDTAWIFVGRCSHRAYSILCRKNHTAAVRFIPTSPTSSSLAGQR